MCNPLSFRAIRGLSVFLPAADTGVGAGLHPPIHLPPPSSGSGRAELVPVQSQLPARVPSALQKSLRPPVPQAVGTAVASP